MNKKSNNLLINTNIIYIIATPIGNLKDITLRAIEILNIVDYIISESFIKSKILCNKYNINKKIIVLNKKNEKKISNIIIKKIINDKNKKYALISDAGTPLINDPGYYLIKILIKLNIKIISLPGPCAIINAIITSGLRCDKFIFQGYFSKNKKKNIKSLLYESKTVVFYESCFNLLKSIESINNILGNKRYIVIAKEMTKIWELFYRGYTNNILEQLKLLNNIKGEYVIIIKGIKRTKLQINIFVKKVFYNLYKYLSYKDSINILKKIFKLPKKLLYTFFLKYKNI